MGTMKNATLFGRSFLEQPSTGQYLSLFSLFLERGMIKSSKINILMDSTSWEYLRLLHFFCWIFHIQSAWLLVFVVVKVQGNIYSHFLYSLRGRWKKDPKWTFTWLENNYNFYIFWLDFWHTNCMTFGIHGD